MIRTLLIIAFGLFLLAANLWFARLAYRQFLGKEYVITPFSVIDPSGNSSDKAGQALAQMMAARLRNIQAQLRATQTSADAPPDSGVQFDEIRATALFVTKPVEIPTDLFAPVEIEATVGGVEVGGVFAFLQDHLTAQRKIQFTTYERAEGAIVAVDLSQFAPRRGYLWFESDKHPDEIATNAAFALLQARLADGTTGRIGDLTLADFRGLIETMIDLDALNRRARRGMVVTDEMRGLLARLEAQLRKTPDWPELVFLAGSTAEGAGNRGRAVLHYRTLLGLPAGAGDGPGTDLAVLAGQRLQGLGADAAVIAGEQEERFIAAAKDFARQMNLPGPDPAIAFVAQDSPLLQAVWNTDLNRYEVNPPQIDAAGLPQYVALMGRFFLRHFDRCIDKGLMKNYQFWNDFRYSVVDYLIGSNPRFADVSPMSPTLSIYRTLKALEAASGTEPVQRLSLELLDRFECDWSEDTLGAQMIDLATEQGLMPESTIRTALAASGLAANGPD